MLILHTSAHVMRYAFHALVGLLCVSVAAPSTHGEAEVAERCDDDADLPASISSLIAKHKALIDRVEAFESDNSTVFYDREHTSAGFSNYGYFPGRGVQWLDPLEDSAAELYLQTLHGLHAYIERGEVLEVGCGTCAGLSLLRNTYKATDFIGVDLSPVGVGVCRSRYGIDASVGNVTQGLPFNAERFHLVLSVEAIQEFNKLDLWAHEASRVLRTGGYIVVAYFCDSNRTLTRALNYEPYDGLTGEWNHACEEIVSGLIAAGFEVTSLRDVTRNVVDSLEDQVGDIWEWLQSMPETVRDIHLHNSAIPGTPMFDFFAHGVQRFHILQARKRRSRTGEEL